MAEQELRELQQHLQQLQQDPSTQLNIRLIDTLTYAPLPALPADVRQILIFQIYQLLPSLQQDPTPLNRFLEKLLEPVPLPAILAFDPPVDFVAGLDLAAQPYNLLTLSILEKADAVSAQRLAASQPLLFASLIRLWLATESEGIAFRSGQVLLHLLRVDRGALAAGDGTGAVWKRVFRDKDVYGLIYAICRLKGQVEGLELSKNRKTIAQARLMDLLPAFGSMDWTAITQSYHPEVEAANGLKAGEEGLLDFAAVHMVDYKDDVLMHRTLISFYDNLISRVRKPHVGTASPTSASLDFLIAKNLHSRTISYYLNPDDPSHDPMDHTFLYGPAAQYLATYMTVYPDHFRSSKETATSVVKRLHQTLHLSPSRWAHSTAPTDDLHVLSCTPRPYLTGLGQESPHLQLPSVVANADLLNTLATLFHGPIEQTETTFPPTEASLQEEKQRTAEGPAAYDLYKSYLSANPTLWKDITSHASTLALKDVAIASLNLLKAVVTAHWSNPASETTSPPPNPITHAILAPASRQHLQPYLLSGPTTFGNLVGGHGDPESAAYKVAVAKFDVQKAVYQRANSLLERRVEAGMEAELRRVVLLLRDRIAEGVWGSQAAVGSRIGVLEM